MKKILKNAPRYTLSNEKDAQIVSELNKLKSHKQTPLTGDYFISLTRFIMSNIKKFAAIGLAVAVVAVVALSGVFQAQTTYASHLENAEKALQELQLLQNSGEEVNQEMVQALIQEAVQETNAALKALEAAKNEGSAEDFNSALMEIKAVQEKSMTMFKNFEGQENEAVQQMVQETNQQHQRVMQMLGEQSGETVREQTHLQNAEQALNQLQLMQQDSEEADPQQVRVLSQKVVQEMNSALEEAKQKQEAEQKQQALQEIQAVQEQAMNMFKNFEEEAVGEAVQSMEQQQERTREMLGEQAGEIIQEQTQVQNKVYSGN